MQSSVDAAIECSLVDFVWSSCVLNSASVVLLVFFLCSLLLGLDDSYVISNLLDLFFL